MSGCALAKTTNIVVSQHRFLPYIDQDSFFSTVSYLFALVSLFRMSELSSAPEVG